MFLPSSVSSSIGNKKPNAPAPTLCSGAILGKTFLVKSDVPFKVSVKTFDKILAKGATAVTPSKVSKGA